VRILILLLIFFCGANFTAAQDTVRNYYPNGRIKEVYAVNIVGKDTIKSGHYTFFYQNGIPYQTGNFKNNQLDSVWDINYPNGQIKSKYTYFMGVLNGSFSHYYDNKQIYQSGTYSFGQLSDSLLVYNSDGSLNKV
jgi:antitoxin component YwqK of YwqJK toxin-antitoxin module